MAQAGSRTAPSIRQARFRKSIEKIILWLTFSMT
jgi:hypothetical protein